MCGESFRGLAPHSNAVNLFDFGATEDPGQADVQQGCAQDQGDENDQLREKGGMKGVVSLMIGHHARGAHDGGTHRDFPDGAENFGGTKCAVTQTENGKEHEEIE